MSFSRLLRQIWLSATFRSSAGYWERRYAGGMDSGSGSYGKLAEFKAQVLNDFVKEKGISSVLEFGCGDGHQLSMANYPNYVGLDVSRTAIDCCATRFASDPTRSFLWYDPARAINLQGIVRAELTLSLDVIYHLVEDEVYAKYLSDLFSTATRYVIVYSSNTSSPIASRHVRHRKFTDDVTREFPAFELQDVINNPHDRDSFADFFIYARK
jgi:SAM-dependent methyltransferase